MSGRQINVEIDGIREKIGEEEVHDVVYLTDQRSDLVRPESPECLHHH